MIGAVATMGICEPSKLWPAHGARLVGLGEVEARVLEPCRVEHALLQQVSVRLACGWLQGLREQVEAEIGIEDTRCPAGTAERSDVQ